MKKWSFRRKRNQVSQAALALSLFALSQSNFGDSLTRSLFGWTAAIYLWAEWIIFPIMAWWFERKELADAIVNLGKERKQE